MSNEHAMTRRCALGMLALGTSAPILTACGSGDDGAGTAPTTSSAPGSDAPTTGGTTQSTPSGSGDGAAQGNALVAVGDVPVGGGVILAGPQIVVTQPTEGEFKGFSAVCPHAQVILSEVSEDDIFCGLGHGGRFTLDDGSVINGPATSPLTPVAVAVEGDQVVRA